jgi:glycosyltransferase involved in cell wall biosynthesis
MVNKIYNASDVYLTTTLGEGWGLGFSEAAACKVPIIAPYTTSFMEMSGYGKNAYMLETIYPYVHTNDNAIREQTDIMEVGENILQVAKDKYSNSLDLKQKIEQNYKWVQKLDWKEVCKSWIEYFKIY